MIMLRVIDPAGEWPENKQPGDMWRWPPFDTDGRDAWVVTLPNGLTWFTTMTAGAPRVMWDVTGDPPRITVTPSIFDHSKDREWHGWIRDGEMVEA